MWHDDAQGTAGLAAAGLINALRIVDKRIADARDHGVGARSSTTIARPISWPAPIRNCMTLFDTKGGLHKKRDDVKADAAFYRKWGALRTDQPRLPGRNRGGAEKRGAHVLIAQGPDTVSLYRICSTEADCLRLREPGSRDSTLRGQGGSAYNIVATGRGDFPQVNNFSMGFPAEGRPARPRAGPPTRRRSQPPTRSREEGIDPWTTYCADDGRKPQAPPRRWPTWR